MVSFGCGTLYALAAFGVALAAETPGAALPLSAYPTTDLPSAWWHYLGGTLGAYYVTAAVFITPVLGSQSYFVALVCGQLVSSAVIDSVGAFGSPVIAVDAARVCGVALVILAASATQLPPSLCAAAGALRLEDADAAADSASSHGAVSGGCSATSGSAEERAAVLWAVPAGKGDYPWTAGAPQAAVSSGYCT